jgi:serine/threonine-protein kinase
MSPDDVEVLVNKAKLLQVTGDSAGCRAVLDRIPADAQNQQSLDLLATQFVLERRYAEAAKLIESYLPKRINEVPIDGFSAQQYLGWARLLAGDREGARQAYVAAKTGLETVQREQPQNPYIASTLGFIEVGLGNKEAALQHGERAVALLPQPQDPVYAPIFEEFLAAIEAQVGASDRALDRIERLLVTPYGAFPLTQATLRVDPIWDRLREHPRFKAIVDGPEPRTIYN